MSSSIRLKFFPAFTSTGLMRAATVTKRICSLDEKKLTLPFSLFLQFSPAGELLHRLSRYFLLTQQHLTNIQKTLFHSPQTLFGLTRSFWVAHSLYSHLLSACFSIKFLSLDIWARHSSFFLFCSNTLVIKIFCAFLKFFTCPKICIWWFPWLV